MTEATVLAHLCGHLLVLDIADVRPGDVVFLGGHLVRRAWTRPAPAVGPQDWVQFQGLRLEQASEGSAARAHFGRPAGTRVLALRPSLTHPGSLHPTEPTGPVHPTDPITHAKEGTPMSYPEDNLAREVRRAAVARAIFCRVTGQVLDVETAVLLESADRQRVLAVLSPQGWAARAEAVRAAMPDVVVTNAPENER